MNNLLDNELAAENGNLNIFHLLVVGMFAYCSASGVASAISVFIADFSIIFDALSSTTFILKEASFFLIFILFFFQISALIFKKMSNKDYAFFKLMIGLVLIYFTSQIITFSYTFWGYEYIEDLLTKKGDYIKEIRFKEPYTTCKSIFSFMPYFMGPIIFIFFGNKTIKQ